MINLVDSITKMNYSRNADGDIVNSTSEGVSCLFREMNELSYGNNRESLDADAVVWFERDASVGLGDIYIYDGEYYRVNEIIKARRMGDKQFIKCGLVRHRQVS